MYRFFNINKSLVNLEKLNLKFFCRNYSSTPAVKVKEDVTEMGKYFEKISLITPRMRKKQPQKPPFAKNLFVGVYDTDVLTYPQLNGEDTQTLEKQISPVQVRFDNLSAKESFLSRDFMEVLKNLQLFGMQSSQLHNCRELNVTEHCRFNEILSTVSSTVPGLIYNEFLGIHALEKAGSDEQKSKYLSQLHNGNMLSAFCMTESENQDVSSLSTTAKLNRDKTEWILNGTKTGVINGSIAGLFIVVAKTATIGNKETREAKLTTFLVEKDFEGITINSNKMLGIEGTDVCDVTFRNTPVPKDNILGEVHSAEILISSLLTQFRLSCGPACSILVKKLLNDLTKHCTHTNIGQLSISETDYVRSIVAEITLSAYAIESITYLTSGLLDEYENQDCLMESSIVKIFGAEQACSSASKVMDILGTPSYKKNHWCNELLMDALSYKYLNEVGENLKIWIALLGLNHAGIQIQEDVRKLRNPLFYAKDIFKRMWTHRKQQMDAPDLKLRLCDYVHPSLRESANRLEYCVLRLQFATETLLARHGQEVANQHMDLKRLAECLIDIYVMTACLGRASRSYCIGLRNAHFEMMLAGSYCAKAMQEVKVKLAQICDGPFATNDENYRTIAKSVFKDGKYPFEHPLARNF
uniref:Acyl-CoA dehydrogenase/oxidase C-terminal domain-containing protein n=1 Tax=Photinus pyralis TaxID=7054 RepID=A0A1Y1M8F1_PHOPY